MLLACAHLPPQLLEALVPPLCNGPQRVPGWEVVAAVVKDEQYVSSQLINVFILLLFQLACNKGHHVGPAQYRYSGENTKEQPTKPGCAVMLKPTHAYAVNCPARRPDPLTPY